MKKVVVFIAVIASAGIISCKKSSSNTTTTVDCTGTTPTFSTNASPVFQTKCATSSGCHASGASNSGGALTNHSQIFNKRSNIRSSVANGSMPQGGTLTATEKQAIICWIDAGAANN